MPVATRITRHPYGVCEVSDVFGQVIAPGFFSSSPVQVALLVGASVAIASGVVGTFTVIRGQSFAGHALSDIGTAGGSASFLLGVPALYGFIAANVAAAVGMEAIGIRRPRGRDLATGIVLGFALGLAALFLYWDSTQTANSGSTVNVLFGSIFTIDTATVPAILALSVGAVIASLVLYRPLLLTAIGPDVAAARGVRVRLIGACYLVILAVAVSLSAITIGAILSTALLIGPAATALRLTARPAVCLVLASGIGVLATAAGILLSYDTAAWSASGRGWPVSFCIVLIILGLYLCSGLWAPIQARWARRR